ncbi:MAG: hypothetical protein R2941_03585 [Desulfobacterales bacterium]
MINARPFNFTTRFIFQARFFDPDLSIHTGHGSNQTASDVFSSNGKAAAFPSIKISLSDKSFSYARLRSMPCEKSCPTAKISKRLCKKRITEPVPVNIKTLGALFSSRAESTKNLRFFS